MLTRPLQRSWRRLGAAAACLAASTLSELSAALLRYGFKLNMQCDAEQILEQAIPAARCRRGRLELVR